MFRTFFLFLLLYFEDGCTAFLECEEAEKKLSALLTPSTITKEEEEETLSATYRIYSLNCLLHLLANSSNALCALCGTKTYTKISTTGDLDWTMIIRENKRCTLFLI